MIPGFSTGASAQAAPLSAQESDPNVMGWMQGFPPPPDKLITQPDSNYFSFPKLRWSVCHLREFLPTELISRGLSAPIPLHYLSHAEFAELRQQIDAVTFTPLDGAGMMTWEESLFTNYTDGKLIIHQGQIVYERYFGCLEEDGKHAIMSMTNSTTGLLGEIPVAKGMLDDTLLVRDVIPDIGDSAVNTDFRRLLRPHGGNLVTNDCAEAHADFSMPEKNGRCQKTGASPLDHGRCAPHCLKSVLMNT